MKKFLTVLFLTFGIFLISGCSLIEQKPVENSSITEQIAALQKQIGDFSSQMETLKNENEELKRENEIIKKENIEKTQTILAQEQNKIASSTDKEDKVIKEFLLYYHNLDKDKEQYDWISCNKEFILPVKRNVAISNTPIKDVFTLLFEAKLTENDLENGFIAGVFETYDFTIKSVILNNGLLKIDFYKNQNLESLSSCERSIFISSLQKTALQFTEIEKIQFQNDMAIGVKNPNDTQM